jgi:hypothetical protein
MTKWYDLQSLVHYDGMDRAATPGEGPSTPARFIHEPSAASPDLSAAASLRVPSLVEAGWQPVHPRWMCCSVHAEPAPAHPRGMCCSHYQVGGGARPGLARGQPHPRWMRQSLSPVRPPPVVRRGWPRQPLEPGPGLIAGPATPRPAQPARAGCHAAAGSVPLSDTRHAQPPPVPVSNRTVPSRPQPASRAPAVPVDARRAGPRPSPGLRDSSRLGAAPSDPAALPGCQGDCRSGVWVGQPKLGSGPLPR